MSLRFLTPVAATHLFLARKSYKKEFFQVILERNSLIYAIALKVSSINSLLSDMNAIKKNPDSITFRQQSIDKTACDRQELSSAQGQRINESVRIINNLHERNRKFMAGLQSRRKNSEHRITKLILLVKQLQNRLKQLNTAYYIIGTFNEQRQKKWLIKKKDFRIQEKKQLLKPDFNIPEIILPLI